MILGPPYHLTSTHSIYVMGQYALSYSLAFENQPCKVGLGRNQKSVNLQYNMLVRWADGRLMFQVLLFFW